MAVIRRFIAGARCPQCGADDSIALNIEGEQEWINCIHCSYHEEKPKAPVAPNVGAADGVQIVHLD